MATEMCNVYSLFDRKAREFGQLVTAANDEAMFRLLADTIRGSASVIERYPEDFDLFICGTFDTDGGVLAASGPSVFVENVADILGRFTRSQE